MSRVLIFVVAFFLFFQFIQTQEMSSPFEKLLQQSRQHNDDSCDGWRDKLVGKVIVNDNEETALSADQIVRKQELPNPHRVLAPNSMATMDYRPDRLNIKVNDNNKVLGVHYG